MRQKGIRKQNGWTKLSLKVKVTSAELSVCEKVNHHARGIRNLEETGVFNMASYNCAAVVTAMTVLQCSTML